MNHPILNQPFELNGKLYMAVESKLQGSAESLPHCPNCIARNDDALCRSLPDCFRSKWPETAHGVIYLIAKASA